MRIAVCLLLAACGSPAGVEPDAAVVHEIDATVDATVDSPPAATGFGELSGMCGVLMSADLTSATPELVRATMTFARAYSDPADRPLLTPGGQHLAETPNAGGSSGLSEIFAYEQLARCEHADLLKTETEIVYDGTGKITDLEVQFSGTKIGVSVTRAQAFPLGSTYTFDAASTLITRKLNDIQASSAHVSAGDKWTKQVLAILAWDSAAADTMAEAWTMADPSVKADTIVIITTTDGEDTFIYTNQ
jgi:hypothetical protein